MLGNISGLEEVFNSARYQISPLGGCVSHIMIKDTNSRMFLCSLCGIVFFHN